MEGFLFFESAVIATTLIGEPMLVVCALLVSLIVYTRQLTDDVFFIFCGAFCVTVIAKWEDWKTKRDETQYWKNVLEAIGLVTLSCFVLPMLIPYETIRILGMVDIYRRITNKVEPFVLIVTLHILSLLGYSPLSTLVVFTCLVVIYMYIKKRK